MLPTQGNEEELRRKGPWSVWESMQRDGAFLVIQFYFH